MDKYEFNIKVEQIKKLVNKGDYETAMKIADSIDWRRVRSTSLLTMVAQVYERNEEYQDAKDILLMAFERAPIGKSLLFKLTDLALREGNIQEAEAYYREFCDLSGDDPRQNLLRYLILEAKEAPKEQQINSLERYCREELDEKWMYHLAELYKDAGREEDCVRMCDKIMLMFGLGKYVDKAMDLKLVFAPLSKYQMDLVENREKYEEKLRAVEEAYKKGSRIREEEFFDVEDSDGIEAALEGLSAEADLPEEAGNETEAEQTSPEEEKAASPHQPAVDPVLAASLHEAEAEEALARSVSELAPSDEEDLLPEQTEDAVQPEPAEGEAPEIEDWDLEEGEEEEVPEASNHLMIEAEDPERGLSLALEVLKKIHQELGTKNPVAKISGDKLSRKGIFAVADRLAGKDLLVERAFDLDSATIRELNDLMETDETGILVVLMDTPARLEQLHRAYPELANKFQYIGCETVRTDENRSETEQAQKERYRSEQADWEAKQRAAEKVRIEAELRAAEKARLEAERRAAELARAEEETRARLEAERQEEEARRRLAEREEEVRRQAARDMQARREAEQEAAEAARMQAELAAEEARRQAEYETAAGYEEEEPAYGEENRTDSVLDVEAFVQHACNYAAEIDCSISGKSMLALYERAEMMEEDGEPLTKLAAEDLIEDAADRAEKKSFGGLFSSKYDKDGLLILKEKHFFD